MQKNVDVFFVLRNPILRFVSAFYYLKEPFWGGRCNEIERRIRDEFDTVNDFVDALRQSSHQHHLLAHESFQRHGYHHFYMSYSFYFGSAENLHKIPVRSCLIGTTEKMNDAIDSLNELAGATLSPDIHENRSVTRRKEALSPINEGFMREYLSHDFEIYQYLLHKYN